MGSEARGLRVSNPLSMPLLLKAEVERVVS